MEARTIRAHVFIQGRVQGINYRWWTSRTAQGLQLTGWVRNLEDGRVEAVFEGPKKKVEAMINKCKRGPMLSRVDHIDVIWEKATRRRQGYGGQAGEFSGFEILPTSQT